MLGYVRGTFSSGDKKCIRSYDREIPWENVTWKTRRMPEYNINMYLAGIRIVCIFACELLACEWGSTLSSFSAALAQKRPSCYSHESRRGYRHQDSGFPRSLSDEYLETGHAASFRILPYWLTLPTSSDAVEPAVNKLGITTSPIFPVFKDVSLPESCMHIVPCPSYMPSSL